MRQVILIAHNLRSSHNVGSLLRTAEGLGVSKVFLTGYTPYPIAKNDRRLPHLANKTGYQIAKTALGAEQFVKWAHQDNIEKVINQLRAKDYIICALEQAAGAMILSDFRPPEKVAIVVGNEVSGTETEILGLCDSILEIPMLGQKESFNVTQSTAMALYHCRSYKSTYDKKQL